MADPILQALRGDFAAENSWGSSTPLLLALLKLREDQLSVRKVTYSNLKNRIHEEARDGGAFCVVAMCDNTVTGDRKGVALHEVQAGTVDTVVVLELDSTANPPVHIPKYLASLENSPLRKRILGHWPTIMDLPVADPGSPCVALRQIAGLQIHYANSLDDSSMKKRAFLLGELASRLESRMNCNLPGATHSVKPYQGQGMAARAPYVRMFDTVYSPNPRTGYSTALFIAEDGSSVIFSLQQAAMRRDMESRRLHNIPAKELAQSSADLYGGLQRDPGMGKIIATLGVARALPLRGNAAIQMSNDHFSHSNIGAVVLSIDSLPCDAELTAIANSFNILCGFLNLNHRETQLGDDGYEVDGSDVLARNIHWPITRISQVLDSLRDKSPQVVLAGPPGTGKTFVARWFASELLGTPGQLDNERITLVQFHPTYGYEDFVEGLRPVEGDHGVVFKALPGPIVKLAQAIQEDETPRVLIIDEINRANIPRVFGELMYLLEYRDTRINLMLQEEFSLPRGLFIIATMNTADKSTRVMDVAMRRRFDFFTLEPDVDVLRAHYETGTSTNDMGEELYEGFVKLNSTLREDLDKHRLIGHSFFMEDSFNVTTLQAKWDRQIAPLLDEYFFERKALESKYSIEGFWPSAAT